ncbi:MAG: hypothetical protein QOI57_3414, partial [Rubrobacteraceae bacterium]|nr:hypothetical protein [Rubrobacteraceae bacterium]
MIKSIKRMVLTGAAVMVMMSFAAPAMAQGFDETIPLMSNYGATYGANDYIDTLYGPYTYESELSMVELQNFLSQRQ